MITIQGNRSIFKMVIFHSEEKLHETNNKRCIDRLCFRCCNRVKAYSRRAKNDLKRDRRTALSLDDQEQDLTMCVSKR